MSIKKQKEKINNVLNNMKNNIVILYRKFKYRNWTEEYIFDKYNEDVCNLCEAEIIEGSSMTWYFQCEGCCCAKAYEMYMNDRIYNDK